MWRLACAVFVSLLSCATASAEDREGYRLLHLEGRPVKWGASEFGAGAALTYAFVTEETSFEDARNCRTLKPAAAALADGGVAGETLEREAAAAFALWEAAANVSFRKVENPRSADILIGVDVDPRGSARADVATWPAIGAVSALRRGLICLSAAQAWKAGFGGAPGAQDLRYTLAHEIGHAIGLDHAGPHGTVMSFNYREAFSDLQPGDVRGAATLYGPAENVRADAKPQDGAATITSGGAR